MTEEQALIRGIIENAEDDTPRLAYRDWLEEFRPDDLRLRIMRWPIAEKWEGSNNMWDHWRISNKAIMPPWVKNDMDRWLCSVVEITEGVLVIRKGFIEEWYPRYQSPPNKDIVRWMFENHPIVRASTLEPPLAFEQDGRVASSRWIEGVRMEPVVSNYGFTINCRKPLSSELANMAALGIGVLQNDRVVYGRIRRKAEQALALACLRIGRRAAGLSIPTSLEVVSPVADLTS
jgi:uncharacterized protein (TIGR02996 family)